MSAGDAALQRTAVDIAEGKQPAKPPAPNFHLLDLQDEMPATQSDVSEAEKDELRKAVAGATEKLDRLGKIRRERDEVLRDLKEKVGRA